MEELKGVVAYADDILIIIGVNSRIMLEIKCNTAMEALHKWFIGNKLKISTEKTQYVL